MELDGTVLGKFGAAEGSSWRVCDGWHEIDLQESE